jgi:hypothetical protein
MSGEECIHGLGPIEACTICNGRDKREKAEAAERPRVFPAKYDGHCPGCNLPIHAGQMIAWVPDARPTHEGCAE